MLLLSPLRFKSETESDKTFCYLSIIYACARIIPCTNSFKPIFSFLCFSDAENIDVENSIALEVYVLVPNTCN